MEATTGTSILGGDTVWYPGEDNNFYHSSNNRKPIVAVCLDASGTAIAAIDEAGNCAIWTVKYSLQYRSTQLQTSQSAAAATQARQCTHQVHLEKIECGYQPRDDGSGGHHRHSGRCG
jgi:hypothetical protein